MTHGNSENSIIRTYKAEFILLLVTLSWGVSFPAIKVALKYISPFLFNFIRILISFLCFFFFYRKKLFLNSVKDWKYGLILGIFIYTGFGFQTLGMMYTSASKSAFITGINLIFIPFIQLMIIGSRPKAENIFGALIVLTGLYVLSEIYFTGLNTGDLLTVFCAISFAVHIVLLDKYTKKYEIIYLLFGQFLAMLILSFIFMIIFDFLVFENAFISAGNELISSVIFTSLFSILLSIILMTKYQKQTTPLRAGIIYNLESIFAVFFAYLILDEIMNLNQIAGAAIMFSGFLFSEFFGIIKLKIFNGKKIQNNS